MWDTLLPKFYDYLTYDLEHSKYKINDYRKKFTWLSKRTAFPLELKNIRNIILEFKRNAKSAGYINYWITAINCFIRWAVAEKLPQEDFTHELNRMRPNENRNPDPSDLLSVEEVQKLINDPSNRPQHPSKVYMERIRRIDKKWSLFLALQYKTASRPGEIIKLRKKDFVFVNHSMTVDGKTGKRTVAIPPDMEEVIKAYVKPLNDSDYLFTSDSGPKHGSPISEEMANRIFKNRARYAGIERSVHVHMLRHSSITHMLVNGAPLSVVQAICGHKRLATTQLYTHILVENQREAMYKYNPLIRKTQDITLLFKRIRDFITDLRLNEDERVKYKIEESANKVFRLEITVK